MHLLMRRRMIELSEQNAVEYVRGAGRVSEGEVLVRSLSGGVANTVLQIFDTTTVKCFVLKQPLAQFKTEAEWRVDIARVEVERDCGELLETLLPAGSVPRMLWFDAANHILAMACAPADAILWKTSLMGGEAWMDAATHAGMLLAILHSSTAGDAAIQKRYGDPAFFIQQRIDPYLHTAAEKNPELRPRLDTIAEKLLASPMCLIHGDYSPKNMFLVPHPSEFLSNFESTKKVAAPFHLSQVMLLDFEVAFYGHPAFDVATLINHLLLKGFYHGKRWRPFMLLADNFWQTYRATVDPALAREVSLFGGAVLGALLLARVDGKSPVEYLVGNEAVQGQVRRAAHALLVAEKISLGEALTLAGTFLETAA